MAMMDLEKVIKGLEVCTSIADGESCPKDCPYYQEVCYGYDQLMRDAIKLLKEQQKQIAELENKNKNLMLLINHQLEKEREQSQIVLCKDCKQGEQSVLPNRHLWCRIHEFYREPDWFCADGERREE